VYVTKCVSLETPEKMALGVDRERGQRITAERSGKSRPRKKGTRFVQKCSAWEQQEINRCRGNKRRESRVGANLNRGKRGGGHRGLVIGGKKNYMVNRANSAGKRGWGVSTWKKWDFVHGVNTV